MKKYTLKRRYLIQNPKEVVHSLVTTSLDTKMIHQLYIENYSNDTDTFGVLSIHFQSVEQINIFESGIKRHLVKDVSSDKRYKNRYLSLFGLPESYDFSLQEVFKKCDKIALTTLDFSFSAGMSTQKVLKVLLYREMQFLEHEVELLLDDDAKALKNIHKVAENICYLFSIGRVVFDNTMIVCLRKTLEVLLSESRATLLVFVQSIHYQTLLLDIRFFLHEQSGFYLLKKSEMPLLVFVNKYLKKEEFRIAKKLKKALI
ncbi:MAG: hypothetical protein PHR87_01090 [Sulfurospirillaceae bacterium]|nr:hypothetical protein [Sulfurospirillaceae bacterium]